MDANYLCLNCFATASVAPGDCDACRSPRAEIRDDDPLAAAKRRRIQWQEARRSRWHTSIAAAIATPLLLILNGTLSMRRGDCSRPIAVTLALAVGFAVLMVLEVVWKGPGDAYKAETRAEWLARLRLRWVDGAR